MMSKCLVLCVLQILISINTVRSVTISAKYDDVALKSVSFITKHPFTLSCNVSDSNAEVKWEKDGTPVNDIKQMIGRFESKRRGSTHTLKISQTNDEDTGNYSCVAYQNGNKEASEKIIVSSKIVVKVPSNINVVEGEKLRIQCNVVGKPYPVLRWKYENDTFNETYEMSEDRIILEKDPEKHIPNAVLRIEEVQMYDRGVFTCIGRSDLSGEGDVQSSSMIRVKDKYAAMWPFIGIVAEVIVLCAIILIYEKKRNKTELEESDTDQSPDQKNTPDNGRDSNLRHRQ